MGATFLAVIAVVLAVPVTLGAQDDPPDALPSDARRTILDLSHATLDLSLSVLDLNLVVEDLNRRTETEEEVRLELSADVLFNFDSAAIKADAAASLGTAAEMIREEAVGDIRIDGHTDAKGADDYNQTLSEQRAESVRDWLATDGGLGDRTFVTAGFGGKPARRTERGRRWRPPGGSPAQPAGRDRHHEDRLAGIPLLSIGTSSHRSLLACVRAMPTRALDRTRNRGAGGSRTARRATLRRRLGRCSGHRGHAAARDV